MIKLVVGYFGKKFYNVQILITFDHLQNKDHQTEINNRSHLTF
jgi:hypothetical protein